MKEGIVEITVLVRTLDTGHEATVTADLGVIANSHDPQALLLELVKKPAKELLAKYGVQQ